MKGVVNVIAAAALLLAAVSDGLAQNATWRARLAVCTGCHGSHGEGSSTGAPRLAGQNPDYMSHALAMFKAGTRASPIMQPIAKSLRDAEIRPLADYFSKLSAPLVGARTRASAQLLRAGKQLAETDSTSCFGCHGPGGLGNGARYPSIAGQPAQFITDRIHEFQARAREKAPAPGSMTAVSTTLSEDQIKSAAAYLSHAPAANKRATGRSS